VSERLGPFSQVHVVPPGHYGASGVGVTVNFAPAMSLASIVAANGQLGLLQERCTSIYGVSLPLKPTCASGREISFVGTGPDRWLAISQNTGLAQRLASLFAPFGAVCDQSDAHVIFDVSGPNARDALAKGVGIDLDENAFRAGDAATTAVALISVTLWRLPNGTFRFAVARSFAASFSRFLVSSAAEFGCDFEGPAAIG
jgi:methylglutamate dehydrogenase subunit D